MKNNRKHLRKQIWADSFLDFKTAAMRSGLDVDPAEFADYALEEFDKRFTVEATPEPYKDWDPIYANYQKIQDLFDNNQPHLVYADIVTALEDQKFLNELKELYNVGRLDSDGKPFATLNFDFEKYKTEKKSEQTTTKPPSDFTGWVKTNPAQNDLIAFSKNGKLIFGFSGVDQWVQTPDEVSLNGSEVVSKSNEFMTILRTEAIRRNLIQPLDEINWNGSALFQLGEHLEPFEILDSEGNWFPF